MTKRRKVIVHIGASADGYIARRDGSLEWLTSRPKPDGLYGMSAFTKSIDTKLLGRRTYETSLRLGAKFDPTKGRTVVFSRQAPPPDVASGVEFVSGAIGPFVSRLREQPGKDIPLIARRHRHVPLDLHGVERFEDGVVQLHYHVQNPV